MAKVDEFLEALDREIEAAESVGPVPPLEGLDGEVEKLAESLMYEIEKEDDKRSRTPVSLVKFRSTTHPETFYVRSRAILLVFDSVGVLGDYEIAEYEKPSYYRDLPDGWTIRLRRPSSTGLFQVDYVSNGSPKVDEHEVKYLAAA